MSISKLLLATLAGSAMANTRLWVTSYAAPDTPNGLVSTLELTPGLGEGALKSVAKNSECGSAPTWLDNTFRHKGTLLCLDEGWATPNASLNPLKINNDGSLKSVGNITLIQGPVTTTFYNDNKALAVAHYGGSAISVFSVNEDGTQFKPLQNITFEAKGPKPEQTASRIHQGLLDPTKKFILFPDLGADLVRVASFDKSTSLLKMLNSVNVPKGYGPRHATFYKTSCGKTFLYVIHELGNKIIGFKVDYPKDGGLSFTQVEEVSTYGKDKTPDGAKAAEIILSPDNNFIVGSNRNATIFKVKNPDPKNSTEVPSDSLVTYQPQKDGKLTLVGLSPSGGLFPRHFQFNKDGSLIAVANQLSFTVDIFTRNTKSGKIGDRVASTLIGKGSGTNNIVWDDKK